MIAVRPRIDSYAADWLPLTKLLAPTHSTILPRPHVVARLQRAITMHRVTLISAPAGYGKSTLLGEWVHWYRQEARCSRDFGQIAWLSLDRADNDRSQFLLAFIATLRQLHPACGLRAQLYLTAQGRLQPLDPAIQVEILVGLIIVDLTQHLPTPLVLVLDNLERITNAVVIDLLNYLLRRLPAHVHIVLCTRHDPPLAWSQLRFAGQVAELRTTDLAFTDDEAVAYIKNQSGIALPPTEIATLVDYAEGWPTGLHLLAQALRPHAKQGRHARFSAGFDTLDPFAHDWRPIDDYFSEEILRQEPRALQSFLLQTAILEELNPTLCQAVTGRADAADVVQDLYRRNLFVLAETKLQTDGDVQENRLYTHYRYQRLFAHFLRRRLQQKLPEQVTRLHYLAATAATDAVTQIPHYLAAQRWEEAAQALEQLVEAPTATLLPAQVVQWIGALPPATRHARPQLDAWQQRLALAHAHAISGARYGLSQRQVEVLLLLGKGASNQTIAEQLFISLPTVKEHVSNLLRIFQARSRREVMAHAVQLGMIAPATE